MSVGDEIGPYRVCGLIGEGGFGRVVVVKNERGEEFAMKIARQEQRSKAESLKLGQLLLNEVTSLKSSEHENIVRLIEVFHNDETSDHYRNCYIVMEKCETDLYKWLRMDGLKKVLNERDACWILAQVACGLYAMRQNDCLHRDLKPQNLLLKLQNEKCPKVIQSYTVKIGDFGLARTLKDDEHAYTLLGTKYYIAPETVGRKYTSLVDIFSFGIIACELLTGETVSWNATSKGACTDLEEILSRHGHITEHAKSFLRGTIAFYDSRMTWNEFFSHEWLRGDIEIQEQINYIRQYNGWMKSVEYLLQRISLTSPIHCFYISIMTMDICHYFVNLQIPDQEPKDHCRWLQAICKGLSVSFRHLIDQMIGHAQATQLYHGESTALFRRILKENHHHLIPHYASMLFEEIIHLKAMAASFDHYPNMQVISHARKCLFLVLDHIDPSSPMGLISINKDTQDCQKEWIHSNIGKIQLVLGELWNIGSNHYTV